MPVRVFSGLAYDQFSFKKKVLREPDEHAILAGINLHQALCVITKMTPFKLVRSSD